MPSVMADLYSASYLLKQFIKKRKYFTMNKLIFALLFFVFIACSGNEKKSTTKTADKTQTAETKKYACPMKCEGEKTYAEAGKCPVCKMDLQEVAMADTDTTSHSH